MSPEELIGKLKKAILPQWKTCFWTALVVGLITHLYKLTNWLPNWDSLVFRYDSQNMVAIGRWFLPIASAPSSFYDLPWITGLLAIVFFALGAVCICKVLNVKKTVTAALIGATVASFPTVTSVLLYNYVADAYAFSFLLSCVAALLLTLEKPRCILAALLICLSVGIYQAYITVTIMLLLCYLIVQITDAQTDLKGWFGKCGKFLLTGIAGMVLYALVLTVVLKVTGTRLLDYQGVNSAASLSGLDLWSSLYAIKQSFVSYFFDFSTGFTVFHGINIVVFALTIVFWLTRVIAGKLNVVRTALLLVLVVLLPFGCSILALVNGSVDYHNLMKMGFVVCYLFFILHYEITEYSKKTLRAVKAWSVVAITGLLVFTQIIIANVSYHKLGIAYEKSYGTLIRIADRIEQTDGANECKRILVLGALEDAAAYSANLPPDITGTTDGVILRADDEEVGQSVLCSALNDYCGKTYTFLAGEEKAALLEKIDEASMGIWPDQQCILVSEGVIVIKLSD